MVLALIENVALADELLTDWPEAAPLGVQPPENQDEIDASRNGERYTRIESALFYLIAEYDACAAGVLSLPSPTMVATERIDVQAAAWCFLNLETFCRLRLSPPLPLKVLGFID